MSAHKALTYYRKQRVHWLSLRGVKVELARTQPKGCALTRFKLRQEVRNARAAHIAYERWHNYHHAWWEWLPDKWQRIGACETGYGKRPGNWRHSNSSYEGAFGFAKSSWDAFKYRADPKAGPYPADAWMATPRQQYEVALAIYRSYGFSGWGCRGA